MKTVIVSLGGSLIVPKEGEIDTNFIDKFRKILSNFPDTKFIIVVGGGKICRTYANAGKLLGCKDGNLDWIGIMATRLNAELIRSTFDEKAYDTVIYNPKKRIETEKIIIAAGYKPGFSTDNDAVLLAKTYSIGDVINLTNIDFVYDKDPRNFADAEPLKNMTWKDFKKLFGTKFTPSMNAPFDPVAAKNASKLNLKVAIMNGNNLENFEDYLNGKDFKGTMINN